jgi:VIT1/CCC1 family predicted Fe2+/Mn2+ transporter
MAAFTVGALLPLAAVLLTTPGLRVVVTAVTVVLALALTGWTSARLGGAPVRHAVARNVGGGVLAMAVTYALGSLVGLGL